MDDQHCQESQTHLFCCILCNNGDVGNCVFIVLKIYGHIAIFLSESLHLIRSYNPYICRTMDPKINKIIIQTLLPFRPKQICVFGSYARGEMDEDSDIDILVDLDPNISLLDLGGAYMDLKEALNRKIDLLLKSGLSPVFKSYIGKDLTEIYSND